MFEQSAKPQVAAGLGGTSAFFGQGTKIVGKISLDGPAQFEGEIEGEITSRDTVTVGASAVVKATIKGATVAIHGRVTGNVEAGKRLELHPGGRVEGDVTTASLVVHEGAVLNGQCIMDARAKGDAKGETKIEVGSISVETNPDKRAGTGR